MNLSLLFSILSKEFHNADLRYSMYDRCNNLRLKEYEISNITHNLLVVSSAIIEDVYSCNLEQYDDSYTIPKSHLLRLFLTGDYLKVGNKYVEVIKTKKDTRNSISIKFSKISESFLRIEEHERMKSIAKINNAFIDRVVQSPELYKNHPIVTLLEGADKFSNGLIRINNDVLFLYYYKNTPVIYPLVEYKGEI